jgi:hypothetical protein
VNLSDIQEVRREHTEQELLEAVAAVAIQLTEVADSLQQQVQQRVHGGEEINRDKFIADLGASVWYLATLADAVDVDLADAAERYLRQEGVVA